MNQKYTFKQIGNGKARTNERMLVCPKCGETLSQPDIETFSCCPFCDYKFVVNLELEDFILEPIVENWIRQQTYIMPHISVQCQHQESGS